MVTAPRCPARPRPPSSAGRRCRAPGRPRRPRASTGRRSPRSSASGRSRRIRARDRARRLRPRPAPRTGCCLRRLLLPLRRSDQPERAPRRGARSRTRPPRSGIPAPCEMMSTSCARSDGKRDRVRMGASLECEVDDAPDHLIVTETGGAAGAGESAGTLRQIAVGIDVDDVGRAVRPEAEVEATVVAQLHRGERGPRHRRDACGDRRQARRARNRLRAAVFGGRLVPLRRRTTRCAAVRPASPRSRSRATAAVRCRRRDAPASTRRSRGPRCSARPARAGGSARSPRPPAGRARRDRARPNAM